MAVRNIIGILYLAEIECRDLFKDSIRGLEDFVEQYSKSHRKTLMVGLIKEYNENDNSSKIYLSFSTPHQGIGRFNDFLRRVDEAGYIVKSIEAVVLESKQ